jgi:hypothetical protein
MQAKALVDPYITERQQAKTKHEDVTPNVRDVLRMSKQMLQKMERNIVEDLTYPIETQA